MLTSPSGEVLPSDVLSRPRLVDPEVAAHAERVLALVRGLADARRARAGLRQAPLIVPVPTKLTDLPSEVLSLTLAQFSLRLNSRPRRLCWNEFEGFGNSRN